MSSLLTFYFATVFNKIFPNFFPFFFPSSFPLGVGVNLLQLLLLELCLDTFKGQRSRLLGKISVKNSHFQCLFQSNFPYFLLFLSSPLMNAISCSIEIFDHNTKKRIKLKFSREFFIKWIFIINCIDFSWKWKYLFYVFQIVIKSTLKEENLLL